MENFAMWILILFLFIILLQVLNYQFVIKNLNINKGKKNNKINNYKIKKFMTNYEKYFYDILVELEDEMDIRINPQVNLASILTKEHNHYYINELFRNIDFGIFTRDYNKLLLLLEINDSTHNSKDRIMRDKKVDEILKNAGVKLIKFYSNYPNKREYVKKRVKDEILSNINRAE